ncbi:MAG: hypothetical protein ACPG7F_13840 [Aggregatilineales bacterium]
MTDPNYFLLIAATFGLLLILSQRLEDGRKRGFRMFIGFVGLILLSRQNLVMENVLGFIAGLFISFVFWLLIGRYNPPGSSDEIKVFGMDD